MKLRNAYPDLVEGVFHGKFTVEVAEEIAAYRNNREDEMSREVVGLDYALKNAPRGKAIIKKREATSKGRKAREERSKVDFVLVPK